MTRCMRYTSKEIPGICIASRLNSTNGRIVNESMVAFICSTASLPGARLLGVWTGGPGNLIVTSRTNTNMPTMSLLETRDLDKGSGRLVTHKYASANLVIIGLDSAPSHHLNLNQCWHTNSWTARNTLQSNFKRNTNTVCQNAHETVDCKMTVVHETVVCKMTVILFHCYLNEFYDDTCL